ncbi:MAG: 23S rRNA (pseudouridine(1915)-N(3))-methyltransferase RlmH [Oscillospiraceae bacterium]|nr:23S rRNA (pseudouridine(1915)-N(3))-methyltransferase RlmH [Oscillospiraceae bacterium]
MQRIHLICVGKLKEPFYLAACAEYQKRLGTYCRLTVTEIPEQRLPDRPSPALVERALFKEAEVIRAKLPNRAAVVALCVEGAACTSPAFAQLLARQAGGGDGKHLVFCIGGSFGLHDSIKEAAIERLSMSAMTFPHHLARVMLLEQIYRGFKIQERSGYHK